MTGELTYALAALRPCPGRGTGAPLAAGGLDSVLPASLPSPVPPSSAAVASVLPSTFPLLSVLAPKSIWRKRLSDVLAFCRARIT